MIRYFDPDWVSLFAKTMPKPMASNSNALTAKVMIGKFAVVRIVSGIFFPPVKFLTPSHDVLSFLRVPHLMRSRNQAEYLR